MSVNAALEYVKKEQLAITRVPLYGSDVLLFELN